MYTANKRIATCGKSYCDCCDIILQTHKDPHIANITDITPETYNRCSENNRHDICHLDLDLVCDCSTCFSRTYCRLTRHNCDLLL